MRVQAESQEKRDIYGVKPYQVLNPVTYKTYYELQRHKDNGMMLSTVDGWKIIDYEEA